MLPRKELPAGLLSTRVSLQHCVSGQQQQRARGALCRCPLYIAVDGSHRQGKFLWDAVCGLGIIWLECERGQRPGCCYTVQLVPNKHHDNSCLGSCEAEWSALEVCLMQLLVEMRGGRITSRNTSEIIIATDSSVVVEAMTVPHSQQALKWSTFFECCEELLSQIESFLQRDARKHGLNPPPVLLMFFRGHQDMAAGPLLGREHELLTPVVDLQAKADLLSGLAGGAPNPPPARLRGHTIVAFTREMSEVACCARRPSSRSPSPARDRGGRSTSSPPQGRSGGAGDAAAGARSSSAPPHGGGGDGEVGPESPTKRQRTVTRLGAGQQSQQQFNTSVARGRAPARADEQQQQQQQQPEDRYPVPQQLFRD